MPSGGSWAAHGQRGLGPSSRLLTPQVSESEAVGTSQAALAGSLGEAAPGQEVDEGRACQVDSGDSGWG